MFELMLLKLPARFCPLLERVFKAGTQHKQKKLQRFQTISFGVTMILIWHFI